jgi:hypothetical protein
MAKRVALLSFSVLCLTLSFLLAARVGINSTTPADASDVVSGSGIVAMWTNEPSGGSGVALDQNGQAWIITGNGSLCCEWLCWERSPHFDPPVPVNLIKFWTPDKIITTDDVFWAYGPGWPTGAFEWHNCGPWPGSPVPTSPNTWGGVKSDYKK